jgi:lysophospholipase L1-like esterase
VPPISKPPVSRTRHGVIKRGPDSRPLLTNIGPKAATSQPTAALGSGLELPRLFAKLSALRRGQVQRVRVSVWGDSHVAGEVLTGHLRKRLQETFGDAGPGFVLLGKPWRSYAHATVKVGASRGWRSERIWARYSRRRRKPRDDLFGVAGISVHARRGASTWLAVRGQRALAAMDLYYLRQPGGGKIEVQADGKRVKWLFTVASDKEPSRATVELPERTKRVEISTKLGEVRLYGADLSSGQPGVVLDTFGINGARASTVLEWNESLMVHQIQQLAPDLLVVAYGSNEVDSDGLTRARLAADVDGLLARLQKAAPQAACLVLGPPDQARFDRERRSWLIPERLEMIVTEQRRVARLRGCAFWDQRAAMGGPSSVYLWVGSAPPLARSDHVHMTPAGYRQVGEVLYQALFTSWSQYHCTRHADDAVCSDSR